ncbi:MAG: sulfotransferase domain-containing protein [Planctomycetes bacterium]|nr:sulfotransferase domain-containing protein [Planctomycetota bacterium]
MLVLKEEEQTWFEQVCYRVKRITGIGVKPDFLILGGQKCGSTTLFGTLIQHPDIFRPRKKEPMYFTHRFNRRAAWYRANFPSYPVKAARKLMGKRFVTFEASPYYLFHPLAPQRVRSQLPDVKLIALLREPVERAYSHYQHMIRINRETLKFEDAIAKEEERLSGEREKMLSEDGFNSDSFRFLSYKARGIYVDQLMEWTKEFPRERLLVLQTEALKRDPQAVTDRVLDFLGLPRWNGFVHKPENVGGYKEPMGSAIREELRTYFKPHNERLWTWLGERWDWE